MEIIARATKPAGQIGQSQELKVAKELEAAFIAEVLKSISPESSGNGFGGGIGEEQFKSFLLEQQANAIMSKGGLGLAAHFVQSFEGNLS